MKVSRCNWRAAFAGRASPRACRADSGITLIEMLVVMSIAAIVLAIAVPSYQYVTTSNRIAGEIDGLLGDLQFARVEAIKEGQTVTTCASSNGTSCSGSTTWSGGWIVFSDLNNDAAVDPGDTVLRVQSGFTSTDTLNASNSVSAITFSREGFATGTNIAGGSLLTLHAKQPNSASTRCLFVTMLGQASVLPSGATFLQFTCS